MTHHESPGLHDCPDFGIGVQRPSDVREIGVAFGAGAGRVGFAGGDDGVSHAIARSGNQQQARIIAIVPVVSGSSESIEHGPIARFQTFDLEANRRVRIERAVLACL